jgi:TRAP-type C4-dicarboxylate transport system permease small subunit
VRRALDLLYDAAGALAAFFILAILVVMVGGSILRELGGRTGGSDDLVSWMCAAAAFLALAHTFKRGDFVRVTLLLEAVGPGVRRVLEIVSLVVASVFCGYLAWSAGHFVYETWKFGDIATGLLPVPLWIPQSSFVVGAVLLFVAVLDELLAVLAGRKPSYVVAAEERHMRGDYTEDL